MFFISKRKVIKKELSFCYNESWKIQWRLRDESLVAISRLAADAVRNFGNKSAGSGIRILKSNDRKATFLLETHVNGGKSYVIKVFFLKRFKERLKYHKYALDETANLIKAVQRNINVPKVYGYGVFKNSIGLVKAGVVILEHLPDVYTIGELMACKNELERRSLFMATIPVFISLYNAACNHIDINPGAIMMSDNADSGVFLLDFQHAKFHDKPNIEILMFETAFFAKSCKELISKQTIDEWITRILTIVNVSQSPGQQLAKIRFRYYYNEDLARRRRKVIV